MKNTACISLLLAAIIPVAAHADSGKIRICRRPGIIGMMDSKSVVIPAGSHFEHQAVPGPDTPIEFIIVTTASTTIGPKPACVTVAAKIETNFAHKPLTTKTGQFHAQFMIAGLEILALPVEDFK
jgi:hypothetical protein